MDIFRGLDLLLMIFVNNVAEVQGLPWWTYHRGNVNGMTYVDMVFPAFLFLMGMSIPLAIDARLARGQSKIKIGTHIAGRALSLLVMGLFIANAFHVDAQHTGMTQTWWASLGFIAIALGWLRFPGEEQRKVLYWITRFTGFALMAALFVVFRRVTAEGQTARLDFSYVEILGLLGWAYLFVSAVYVLVGKRFRLLLVIFGGLVGLNALSTMAWLDGVNRALGNWNPFEAGLCSLTMAGVLASLIIVGNSVAADFRRKLRWMVGAAAVLLTMGFLLQPLGISKNRDTPTWCLYCTAANLATALLLYSIADIRGWRAWANFAKPIGENPLLAYILAYIPFLVPPLYALNASGTSGGYGVFKSAMLTLLMLLVTQVLVRCGVSLRL